MISIVIPTVKGREEHLRGGLAAYAAHTEDYELLVIPNDGHPCGTAWVEGADQARGDYIHLSADDLLPHKGWWQAAVRTVDLGVLSAPRILNGNGALETCGGADGFTELPTGHLTDFTRIPFLTGPQWRLIRPLIADFLMQTHYYTDNAVSWAAGRHGVRTAVCREYLFTHNWAQAGRGAGMSGNARMRHDHALFQQLIS